MIDFPRELVIFAGGKGSRLSSLGQACPKPAIIIEGKPLIAYLIDWAQMQEFENIIIAGGHLCGILEDRLAKHYRVPLQVLDKISKTIVLKKAKIIIRNTGEETQTAERLLRVRDLLDGTQMFVVTYGDTLTDLVMREPWQLSVDQEKLICLVAGLPDERYGELKFNGNLVTAFKEKGRPDFYVNRGFFTIRPEIFDHWDSRSFQSFERDVLPFFTEKNEVAAYKSKAWFFSVDTEIDALNLSKKIRIDRENFG